MVCPLETARREILVHRVPCPVIDSGSQGARDGLQVTAQGFLFDRLGLIADSQLLRITIAGAYKVHSGTLTTRVSPKITLG